MWMVDRLRLMVEGPCLQMAKFDSNANKKGLCKPTVEAHRHHSSFHISELKDNLLVLVHDV